MNSLNSQEQLQLLEPLERFKESSGWNDKFIAIIV